MIPLNAQEAIDLLRHRAREIAQCERQIGHFEQLASVERARLARLRAEAASLSLTLPEAGASPNQTLNAENSR